MAIVFSCALFSFILLLLSLSICPSINSDNVYSLCSFNPNANFDPWDECCIWSFYYFFYSKKLKRIVFFAYRAVRFVLKTEGHSSPFILLFVFFCSLAFLFNNRKDDADVEEQEDTGYTSFDMDEM